MKGPKILAAALFAAVAFAGAAQAQAVKVGIAAEPYPPFASPDASGAWVGWEVEMIGAVCAEAKLECEITPVAWDGIIPALTAKKIADLVSECTVMCRSPAKLAIAPPMPNANVMMPMCSMEE